jgi:glucose-1-phosphate cytidylyltransferase
VIKDYFLNYYYHKHSLSIDLKSNNVQVHDGRDDEWIVHLLDTGLDTMTGGRIKQVSEFIGDEPFLLTYGDGVSDVDISQLVEIHKKNGKMATITAVHPASRYGELKLNGEIVEDFTEKPQIGGGWINGGFFVLEPEVANLIEGNHISWEREPLNRIVDKGQLAVYTHEGYWQCMDSLRDVQILNDLWDNENAKWKVW